MLRCPCSLLAAGATLLASTATAAAPPDRSRVARAADVVVAAGIPGVEVFVRSGGRTFTVARGVADLKRRTPVRPADRFRIGSITKSYVAAVALQLVDEGALSFDDPVARWVPGVPGGRRITIHQLLQQTSGLYDYSHDPAVLRPYLAGKLAYRWSPPALLALLRSHRRSFAPGVRWEYSNSNYLVLGRVVEAVTKHTLAAELRARILLPFGLRATTFAERTELQKPFAHGYTAVGANRHFDVSHLSASWAWAAGAMAASASDVARFYRALLTGRVVSRALLAEMKQTVSMGAAGEDYGLGLWHTRTLALGAAALSCGRVWGHNGEIPGYFAEAFSTVDAARQVVILGNGDLAGLGARGMRAVLRLADAALCGT